MKIKNGAKRRRDKIVAHLVSGDEFWTPQRRAGLQRRLARMNLKPKLPENIRREWLEFIAAD